LAKEAEMRKALLALTGLVLAGGAVSLGQQNQPQEKPKEQQAPAEEAKIPPEDAQRHNPVKLTPEGLAQARRVYRFDCAMCHGANGDGKGELAVTMNLPLHDWRDAASIAGKTDGELFFVITKGKGKMTGEGDRLKPGERWNLVNLVRSFAKKESGAPSPAQAPPKEGAPEQ
jgi:mono/diheme cytochrome c family protein